MTVSQDDLTSVTVGQFYPYPVEQVWAAITSPASIFDWTTEVQRDSVATGTTFSFSTFPKPEVNFDGCGECEFTDVVPNERMACRFTTADKAWDLQVTWTLHAELGGTRLLIVTNGFELANPAHERLRGLLSDTWTVVMSRIAELLSASPADRDPPVDDATSFSLGEFYPHPPEEVWEVVTSPEFVGDVVNAHDLQSVETGGRLTVTTYPIPTIGFTGKVQMEFLEVRVPELIACTFEIDVMDGTLTFHMNWRLRRQAGGTQLWFTLSGFNPRSQLNRQLRSVLRGGVIPLLSRVGELLEGRTHDQ